MRPEDIPTIEQILTEYAVSDYLGDDSFADLIAELQHRENVMITEIGPLVFYKRGLDNIINQY